MEKGFEQIVAALAVLETGRAFLPISAGQPDQRIQTILDQAGVRDRADPAAHPPRPAWQSQVVLLDGHAERNPASASQAASAAPAADAPRPTIPPT